jgi:DNA invertase Pin-like site-specific DNA recombinase
VDVVIVRDIDRLTRNLTDWNAFEKACVRHGVRLSAYTGGTWTCPRPRRVLRRDGDAAGAAGKRGQERRVREARTARRARAGGTAGGSGGSGTTRIYANRTEPNHKKRHIVRRGNQPGRSRGDPGRGETGCWSAGIGRASIARDWTARGIRPGSGEAVVADARSWAR